ncbi:hypothetical protein [Zobellia uliginosa]|uniref:hypothetical protein n=1 Tax=Zobellia uliginosa TaxID=143224 RepID=UPI001C065697|nr:hypothetical protein [Zobellia uliginosa]MBU2946454.1 hypothetical protein [Zobellia uliginosa]
MTSYFKLIRPYVLVGAFSLLAFSCSDETDEILDIGQEQEDKQEQKLELEQTELATIFDLEDLSSAADITIDGIYGNRDSSNSGKDETCYTAVYTDKGFTATFNDCEAATNDYIMSGSIEVVYGDEGDAHNYTVTYNDFSVGGIQLNGKRSVGVSVEGSVNGYDLILDIDVDMGVVLEDGRELSEEGTKNYRFMSTDSGEGYVLQMNGEWIVNTDDDTYNIDIANVLQAESSCDYIGKGIMELAKNGLTVDVDFGDGSCDDVADLIYPDGTKEVILLKKE